MYNEKTERIVPGHINVKLGYKRDTLCLDDGRLTLPRQRLVYESFYPDEELLVINHKNGIRYDNRIENLENVSASENLTKAYTETKRRKVRHCCFEREGEKKVFFSITDAARYFQKNEAVLRQAINRHKNYQEYECYELSEEEYNSLLGSETIRKE